MKQTKFTSLKQYLVDRLCFIKAKKTHTDQSTRQALLLCSNRNDLQTFKSNSCKKNFLECACYRCNLLR